MFAGDVIHCLIRGVEGLGFRGLGFRVSPPAGGLLSWRSRYATATAILRIWD